MGPCPVEEIYGDLRVGSGLTEDLKEEGWGEAGREVEGVEQWNPVASLQENGGDLDC